MGIIDPTENANDKHKNSEKLISQSTSSIKQKERGCTVSEENKNFKSSNKKGTYGQASQHQFIGHKMSSKHRRLNKITQEQGNSCWLTVLPIKQLERTWLLITQRAHHVESTSIRHRYYVETSKKKFRRFSTSFLRIFSI